MRIFPRALHTAGTAAVHLCVVTADTPALAFYDRMGFHEIRVPDPGPVTHLGRATRESGEPTARAAS
ncbi:hypothetical protein [Streptomyces scabiei]|uniref:hypothetical protein n=1 Tax=Streptomyces scabiei TaxID=1930 RepID=UPI0039F65FFE